MGVVMEPVPQDGDLGVLTQTVEDMRGRMAVESARLQAFREVFESNQLKPPVPREMEDEKRRLATLARSPWLRLVVLSTAQPLRVAGYRNEGGETAAMWEQWLRNDMDSRQATLHTAVVTFGYAFMVVEPGESDQVVMRPVSPQNMWAEWEDPYADEFPIHALRRVREDKFTGRTIWKYYDDQAIYTLESSQEHGAQVHVVDVLEHSAGVCPVVRYENLVDLEGNCFGEIEPYMDVAARLDLTTNDRLLVQRFNSWKILYATNLVPPQGTTKAEREQVKARLRNDDFLVGGKDVQFGTLDETSMTPFIAAQDADKNALAALSQTPLSMLTGEQINLGADAITTSYRPWREKLKERCGRLGDSHARMLRTAAAIMGNKAEAENWQARVLWDDVEDRSLAQTADAFGKLAQMLDVPPQALWGRIPGITQSDVEEWKLMYDARQREQAQIEALAMGDTSLELPTPSVSVDTGTPGPPRMPQSYEDQPKPWGAKRGPAVSKSAMERRKRRRDGDGDGVVDE